MSQQSGKEKKCAGTGATVAEYILASVLLLRSYTGEGFPKGWEGIPAGVEGI